MAPTATIRSLEELLDLAQKHHDFVPIRSREEDRKLKPPPRKKLRIRLSVKKPTSIPAVPRPRPKESSDNKQPSSIAWLHNKEVILHITSYLDPQDILFPWLSCCKTMHKMKDSSQVWKHRLQACFDYFAITHDQAQRIDLHRHYDSVVRQLHHLKKPKWERWTEVLTHLACSMQNIYGKRYEVHPIHRAYVVDAMITDYTEKPEYLDFNHALQKWDFDPTDARDVVDESFMYSLPIQDIIHSIRESTEEEERFFQSFLEVEEEEEEKKKASKEKATTANSNQIGPPHPIGRFQRWRRYQYNPMLGSPFGLDEYQYQDFIQVTDPSLRDNLIDSGHRIYIMECHSEDYGLFVSFERGANGQVIMKRENEDNLLDCKYNSLLHWYIAGRIENDSGYDIDDVDEEEKERIERILNPNEFGRRLLWIKHRRLLPTSWNIDWKAVLPKDLWEQQPELKLEQPRANVEEYDLARVEECIPVDLERVEEQMVRYSRREEEP